MSKVEIKVYALPTNKASHIKFIPKGEYEEINGKLVKTTIDKYLYVEEATEFGYPSTFLYVTTSETPQIGDWFLVELFKITGESDGLHLEQCLSIDDVWINNTSVDKTRHIDNCKKVVATDDKDLKYNDLGSSILNHKRYGLNWENHVKSLPQISPEFKQAWVREANKGTPILEALMEFTDLGKDACKFDDNHLDSKIENLEHNCLIFGGKCSCLKKIPKLNPQGYVTILPVKEKMYPIDALRESFKGARRLLPSNDEESDFNKWLKMYETVNL